MFSFIKQKKIMDDLSTIKKKQLVKHANYIIEKRNEIKKMQELDGIGQSVLPKTAGVKPVQKSEQKKKHATSGTSKLNNKDNTSYNNSRSFANSANTNEVSAQAILSDDTVQDLSKDSALEFPQTEYQNHLFKIAEQFEHMDPELSMFYMKRFYNEMNSSDNLDKHTDKYAKCCLFCGHSFLSRDEGYHLMKQPSNKVVIRDVTKDEKLCSLNLKKFFGSKKERVKWSNIVHCLCTTRTASNNVLTYRCKSCHKYLIVPFDKDVALTTSKSENKQECVQRKHQTSNEASNRASQQPKSQTSSNEVSALATNENSNILSTKSKKKGSQSQHTQTAAPKINDSNEKKRKRENVTSLSDTSQASKIKDPPTSNNESKKKKKKNASGATSASDFLKML
ncbi:hypothetical protein C9374_001170 [Naegleria lovaniensis]|uniref:Uncharacterized protein n=1 Tax=Naegleria lovaniensis TaxID=51637 RepID=A0AA88GX66_NAELO|nr:uncharacterized protein C9374_001170 [Naegleria lovaniensis]KAG2387576.1 hypothetical protein C9374_001170 [Naegleria lovaniensis]